VTHDEPSISSEFIPQLTMSSTSYDRVAYAQAKAQIGIIWWIDAPAVYLHYPNDPVMQAKYEFSVIQASLKEEFDGLPLPSKLMDKIYSAKRERGGGLFTAVGTSYICGERERDAYNLDKDPDDDDKFTFIRKGDDYGTICSVTYEELKKAIPNVDIVVDLEGRDSFTPGCGSYRYKVEIIV